jgi:phage terminase small subunit
MEALNMGKELTDKERRFVGEYLITLDANNAAKKAGFSSSVAASKAYQWVSNGKVKPHVYSAVQEAICDREARTKITQDRVIQELARIGFSDLRNLINDDGSFKHPSGWSADAAAAVASFEVATTNRGEGAIEHVAKIRAWDKVQALEKLAKHLGLYAKEGGKGANIQFNFGRMERGVL